jgi:hypothetical protein
MQAEQLTGIYRNILSNQHESYSFGQTNMLFFGNVDLFFFALLKIWMLISHHYSIVFFLENAGELRFIPLRRKMG